MFQFIRKHQAIGLIFIGIVIVSFVIFFSPNQGGGSAMPRGSLGSIRGVPIEREDYIRAAKEASLSHMLREGSWPDRSNSSWNEQQQVFDRLFLLDEARRMGIDVSDEVAAGRIVELPFLRDDRTGAFNRAAYDQFLAILLREQGITRQDFEQFMRHEVALQHLVQIGGLSGTLVPPREAEQRFRDANSRFGAQLVMFSATNHLASVNTSPERVAEHYTNFMAEYRIPERVQVRYVRFASSNFLAEADQELLTNTNLPALLDAEYQRRDPTTFRDAAGNIMTPEAAKESLKEQSRNGVALDFARKKANEFANRLYKLEPKPESLSQLAEEMQLEARISAPFDQFRPPQDMQVPSTFNRAAFSLSATEPFATPVIGEDAVYVFAFERRLPASFEPLESVQGRVLDSLVRTESRNMAMAAGRAFAALATNAIAQGKTFEAAATEAGHSVITLTNFSRSTLSLPELGPRLTVSELLRTAEELDVDAVSPFTPAADGGYVMRLTSRDPVPDEELKQEIPEYLKQIRQFGRFSAFMEWERHRFANADIRIPGSNATNAVAAAGN